MKVIIHQTSQGPRAGERLPLVSSLDSLGLDPYMSAWSMTRRLSLTPSSRENALYDLLALRLWGQITQTDIEQIMLYGDTLSPEQVRDLVYHLHLKTKDLRILATQSVLHINTFYDSAERISTGAFLRRTSVAWDYLEFLGTYGNRLLRKTGQNTQSLMTLRANRLSPPDRQGHKLIYKDGSIAKELLSRRPKNRQSRLNTHATTDLENFALALMDINRDDVWPKNQDNALRNELILKLLVETGLRSGELRQIKIEDLRQRNHKIEIPRRHNDPDSKGRREANAKTFDGIVSLTPETWNLLTQWLDVHTKISETVKEESPFLLINTDRNPAHRGQQLSGTTVNKIIKDFCTHANLPKLSAHPLRHLRARRLIDLIREKNLSHEQARKAITYLMRWSDESQMLAHYLGDHADTGAEKTMEIIHSDRFTVGGGTQ